MNLNIATIPEDDAVLADWLEEKLISPELPALIGELAAMASFRPESSETLCSVLGTYRNQLLETGLKVLPPQQIRRLMSQPALLDELLMLVLEKGGPHWDQRLKTPENEQAVARINRQVRASLTAQAAPAPPGKMVRLRFYRRPWLVSFATAAAVLIGVYFAWPQRIAPTKESEWGWNRPDLLAKQSSRTDVFRTLADAANEWKSRPKDSREAFRVALLDMRNGCTRLMGTENIPLAAADREWLMSRCRRWGRLLDWHLAALNTETDWQRIRDETNETIETMVKVLRERATT